jgi:hypothetical protein
MPEFDNKRNELSKKQIMNGKPPDPKPQARPAMSEINGIWARLNTARAHLEPGSKPRYFLDPREDTAWRERTKQHREDLAGYWNDVRSGIGYRSQLELKDTEAAAFKKALDWLEAADQGGGVSQWLDRWQVEIRSGNPNVAELASAAESLRDSIRFSTELLSETLNDGSMSERAKQMRAELAHILDAIGPLIAGQIKDIHEQKKIVAGSDLATVAERLKAEIRVDSTARMRNAVAVKRGLRPAFFCEMPHVVQAKQEFQRLGATVSGWQVTALAAAEVAKGAPTRNQQNDMKAATDLDGAATQLGDRLAEIATWKPGSDPGPLGVNDTLFDNAWVTSQILLDTVIAEHERLAGQLLGANARSLLMTGPGTGKLKSLREGLKKLRESTPEETDIYSITTDRSKALWEDPSKKSSLGRLWSKPYEALANDLESVGLAGKFKSAFGNNRLDSLLDRFYRRTPGDAAQTRDLSWQLLGTIREMKSDAATVLKDSPAHADYMILTLDAINFDLSKRVATELASG